MRGNGAVDPTLASAYESCRRMQRRHDPTYYCATSRLPREVRPAVHALYGFVRGADEIVDGPRRLPEPSARRAALDSWEEELLRGLETGRSSHPIVAALVDAGRRHRLPLEHLRVYMRSMRIDCGPVRIESREELERYMQGSAASVGRIMAPLLGAPPEEHETFARLGVAFQLANFIRDVREDYALDRVYLPREERERFHVSEADIARGDATAGFRALLAQEVGRARALFEDTAPATRKVGREARPGIRLARAIYLRTLDRVEAIGFDVFRRRPTLRAWQVGSAAVGALRAAP